MGDGVATEEGQKTGADFSGETAPGFRGGEKGSVQGEGAKEMKESRIGEVVEKKISEDEIYAGGGLRPRLDIGGDDRREPILASEKVERGVGDTGLTIEEKETGPVAPVRKSLGKESGEEVTVAATEID